MRSTTDEFTARIDQWLLLIEHQIKLLIENSNDFIHRLRRLESLRAVLALRRCCGAIKQCAWMGRTSTAACFQRFRP